MTDETLVRDVLHRATDDLTAHVPGLTAAAAQGGRRLRRRRRAMTAAGTFCAATLVAVPVIAALGGSNPTTSPQVATDPTPTPSTTPTPSVEPTPHLVDNDGWAQMPAAEMAATFEGLAPASIGLTDVMLTNEDRAPGEPETKSPGYLLGDLTVDGTAAGGLNVILYVTGQPASKYTCPGNLIKPDTCTEIRSDDGEVIGRRSVSTPGDVVINEVVLVRSNGGLVYVMASNSTDDKPGWGATVAGATAPLTLDQLQAIAEDDAWIGYEPPADPGDGSE
jgi:hypothetical protein